MSNKDTNTKFLLATRLITKKYNPIKAVRGDYGYYIDDILQDDNSLPFDLSGYRVEFHVFNQNNPYNPMFVGDAVIVNETLGQVEYRVKWYDFLTSGIFRSKWLAINTGTNQTYPFEGYTIKVYESR